MGYNGKIDLDTKFANWNGWYNDLFEEIKTIRAIGGQMLLDPKENIHKYYSLLLNLYSTHSSYIKKQSAVYKNLQNIKTVIYSAKFHRALSMRTTDLSIINVMSDMITIFTHINRSFQEHGIVPKVTAKKETDPGNAMAEQEY